MELESDKSNASVGVVSTRARRDCIELSVDCFGIIHAHAHKYFF